MPIEKGVEWGVPGQLPDEAPIAHDDAEAARLINGPHRVIGLDGGDLARTLGIRKPYDRDSPKHLVPIDAIEVRLDDESSHLCIAHIVAGRLLRDSSVTAVMNSAFIERRNLAPRAHPGDGKADVVTLELQFVDRLKALRRMATGSHIPHPGITVRRSSHEAIELGARRTVRIDGQPVGRSSRLIFTVVPDAITVAVS